jgi:hypothetical protein
MALFVSALPGCTVVTASRPVGQPILMDLEGTWRVSMTGGEQPVEEIYFLRLMPDGSIAGAKVDSGQANAPFVLQVFEVVVSTHKGALYLNFKVPESAQSNGKEGYYFLRALAGPQEPETFILLPARVDTFREAVMSGKFETETWKEVEIEYLKIIDMAALQNFLDPEKVAEQFNFSGLGILQRLDTTGQLQFREGLVIESGIQLGLVTEKQEPAVLTEAKQAHMDCLKVHLGEDMRLSEELRTRREIVYLKESAGFDPANIADEKSRVQTLEKLLEARFVLVDEDSKIIEEASLGEAELAAYRSCMETRGYQLIEDPETMPERFETEFLTIHEVFGHPVALPVELRPMWVAKNGLALFIFRLLPASD